MDACQRVNNVVYARRLETAPMAYLERIGLVVDRLRGAIAAVEAPGAG
jgi:acyl-CoA thioesterase FadM